MLHYRPTFQIASNVCMRTLFLSHGITPCIDLHRNLPKGWKTKKRKNRTRGWEKHTKSFIFFLPHLGRIEKKDASQGEGNETRGE